MPGQDARENGKKIEGFTPGGPERRRASAGGTGEFRPGVRKNPLQTFDRAIVRGTRSCEGPTLFRKVDRRNASVQRWNTDCEGRIYFEGTATALRASRESYLQQFLFITLRPW